VIALFADVLLFSGFGMPVLDDFTGIAKSTNPRLTNFDTSIMISSHLRNLFSSKINESRVILLSF